MNNIETLANYFKKFPGIGTRQAHRFVYFLLMAQPDFVHELTEKILSVKKGVVQCTECHRYFERTAAEGAATCPFCNDTLADRTKLLIVEKDTDLLNIRKSGAYSGRFFVLGSLIPLTEIRNEHLSPVVSALKKKVETDARKELKEVVVAFSATPEGDHTAFEIKNILEPLQKQYGFVVSTLGRGLSTGSELEYADSETLKNALENRKN